MEPLLGLIVAALVAAPAILWRWHRNQALADAWRLAASGPGGLALQYVRSEAGVFSMDLAGHREELVVTVSRRKSGGNRAGRTVMAVSSPSRLGWHLGLSRETLGTQLNQLMGERDIKTGDRGFDADVAIYGDQNALVAILDEPARRAIRQALQAGVIVESGRIERELPRGDIDWRTLVRTGGELLDLAQRLTTPRNVAGKLAANAGRDPDPAVRGRNLENLIGSFADRPEAGDAARAALEDADPMLRLVAGRFLGAEGHRALLALAGDLQVPEPIAVAALEALGDASPFAQLAAILDQVVPAGRFNVARAAAAALGRHRDPGVAATLTVHLASADPGLAVAAAHALGASGDPQGAASLTSALASALAEVRVAAASALARLGTVNTVAPLRRAVDDHPLDLGLRRAALGAIAAIQARLTGAAPGQLGLADGEAGSLALAEGQGGDVALAPSGEATGASDEILSSAQVETSNVPVPRPGPKASAH